MFDIFYWILCALGVAVTVWYETSRYTKLTVMGTISMLCISVVLFSEVAHRSTPSATDVVLVFGIVVKLLDRLVRKAIYEPRGWCCHEILKGGQHDAHRH